MLNIARIEAGELHIKPDLFDVNETVIKTVFTFETPLEEKNIEVRGLDHDRVMVEADPDLIHQVVPAGKRSKILQPGWLYRSQLCGR